MSALVPRKRSRKWYALGVGLLASIGLCASTTTASASTGSPMTVQNGNSHLCMSIPNDVIYAGQVINQWDCGGYPDQYWSEEPSASHPNEVFSAK